MFLGLWPKTAYWQVLSLLWFELAWLPSSLLLPSSSSPSLSQFCFLFPGFSVLVCFVLWDLMTLQGGIIYVFENWQPSLTANLCTKSCAPFLMLLPLFLAGEELKRSETNFERRNYIQAMAKNPGAIEEIETVNLNYLLLFLRQFCQSRLHCLTNWLHNNWPGVIILLFTHYARLLVNIKVDYIKFRHVAEKTSFKSQWTMVICNAAHKEVMVNMFWQKVCSSCTPLRDSSPSQYRFITRNIF